MLKNNPRFFKKEKLWVGPRVSARDHGTENNYSKALPVVIGSEQRKEEMTKNPLQGLS